MRATRHFNAFSVPIYDPSFSHPHFPIPPYKFDKRTDVERPRLLRHPRRLGRKSIDPAIHFEDGGRKRAATTFRRMADRETKQNRSWPFNVSRLYRRPYIIVPISRLRDLETLRFFFSRDV